MTAILETALEKEEWGRFWKIDSPFEGVASTTILPNEIQAEDLCTVGSGVFSRWEKKGPQEEEKTATEPARQERRCG